MLRFHANSISIVTNSILTDTSAYNFGFALLFFSSQKKEKSILFYISESKSYCSLYFTPYPHYRKIKMTESSPQKFVSFPFANLRMASINPKISPIFAYNNNYSFSSESFGHTLVWILASICFFFSQQH